MLQKQISSLLGISILFLFIFFIFGGFFGYLWLQDYETKQVEKEQQLKFLTISHINQQYILQVNQEKIKDLESRAEQEKLSREVLEKQRESEQLLSEQKIRDLEEQIAQTENYDLVSIIEEWRPIIAYIECDFYYKDTDIRYLTQTGSGLLVEVFIFTNKHTITDKNEYAPEVCRIKLPNYKRTIITDNIGVSKRGYDWATLLIEDPDEYIWSLSITSDKICQKTLSVGDKIVILGYPTIGAKEDLTATEGIISGYDGDYYITSAKIEKGNSGGAAIALKNNCYLGIPAYAKIGEIESLSRILRGDVVFDFLFK